MDCSIKIKPLYGDKIHGMGTHNINITYNDIPYICRICLSKINLKPFEEYYDLMKLFQDITDIQIEFEYDLPKNVCIACIGLLENISSFISFSKTNDTNLKQIITENMSPLFPEEINYSYDNIHSYQHSEELQIANSENNVENTKCYSISESNKSKRETKLVKNQCSKCGDCFATKRKLLEHQKKNLSCKTKKTKFKVKLHLRPHTKETSFECNICFKKFRQSSNLKRHKDAVHKGLKPFKCEICGKEYARLAAKNEHMFSHSEEDPHSSVYCGKSGERQFLCNHCGKSFVRKRNLDDHTTLHTGEKPHVCKYCGKRFRLISGYKNHILIHTGEKPFQCKVCDKSFVQSIGLRLHTRTHTGEKPYKCTFCGKCFSEKSNLKVHTRIHTGEKPFECRQCGKHFRQAACYKNHLLIHKGERSYQCEVCQKTFIELKNLQAHIKTHTGEKPYKCTFCGKSFARNGNLKCHTRIHTGERPYQCSICLKGFYDSTSMKKHRKSHGNVQDTDNNFISSQR